MSSVRADWRLLVYGDWTWFVRDPLDLLRLAFVAGTIAFALSGNPDAAGLTAASVLLLVARIIDLPRSFDLGIITTMTLIAWGPAFHLYGDYFWYDNLVHTVTPFFYAPALFIALVRLGVLTDPAEMRSASQRVGVFVTTVAIGMAVGAGWEVIEWTSDSLLGSHFVKSIDDTGGDLLSDTIGSAAGAAFVTIWSIRHWTTKRATAVRIARPAAPAPGFARRLASRVRLRVAEERGAGFLASRFPLAALPLAAQGAIEIGAGVLILVWPEPALRTVEIVLGLALLGDALFDLVGLVAGFLRPAGSRSRVTSLAVIALQSGIGTLLLALPEISRFALLYAIAATAIVLALLEAAALSSGAGRERDRWLAGAASASSFVFGIALLAMPGLGLEALTVVFGLFLLNRGGLRLLRAVGILFPSQR